MTPNRVLSSVLKKIYRIQIQFFFLSRKNPLENGFLSLSIWIVNDWFSQIMVVRKLKFLFALLLCSSTISCNYWAGLLCVSLTGIHSYITWRQHWKESEQQTFGLQYYYSRLVPINLAGCYCFISVLSFTHLMSNFSNVKQCCFCRILSRHIIFQQIILLDLRVVLWALAVTLCVFIYMDSWC